MKSCADANTFVQYYTKNQMFHMEGFSNSNHVTSNDVPMPTGIYNIIEIIKSFILKVFKYPNNYINSCAGANMYVEYYKNKECFHLESL